VTHELVGVGSAVVVAQALDLGPAPTAGMAVSALLGSRLPDVDVRGARVHRRTLLERRLRPVRLAGTVVRLPLRFGPLLRHRGVTHSLLAWVAASLLVGLIASLAGAAVGVLAGSGFALGYGTHIAADACTTHGVRPWIPFRRRRLWLLPAQLRIKTSSPGELGFALAFVLLAAAALAVVT
jgi:membrane-bound metal-dependent hydrolase YbcI (DUF457 family)